MRPRTPDFLGTNGLALIRAIDWRTSCSRSRKASRAKDWPEPGVCLDLPLYRIVGEGQHAQSVWWIRMISSVPSRRWEIYERADRIVGGHPASVADHVGSPL